MIRGLMKSLLWGMIGTAMLIACSSDKAEDIDAKVGQAAKAYYDKLLSGKYTEYVDGFYRAEKIPNTYHAQLVENAKLFVALQKEAHQGIVAVDVTRVQTDTLHHKADVFLTLCYADSVKEQVVVPMIQKKGDWLMR